MTSPSNESLGDTPATSADPEGVAEGDTDQLQQEDTLLDRGVDSVLDEGYSPPDRPPGNRLETHLDQLLGERLDDKLAQEEPEVWDVEDAPAAGAREADRAGRLAVEESGPTGEAAVGTTARDVGISGGAATAEEAAMHVVEDDEAL
ncbi:DUF5709 domain-containing protein [Actinotalea ferrariae]|uniref:DUF5709 domain-containing protein n=1 Tax=Actinotalea ferrariae TaxID=1386098 RepID=UPI000551D0CF|nr:DUF5709 domain-containing protein [Actinotalea ferrariae]